MMIVSGYSLARKLADKENRRKNYKIQQYITTPKCDEGLLKEMIFYRSLLPN